MLIKGLQKTTLSDFPGQVACIVFTAGCNLRCPYCHNPELITQPALLPSIPEEEFFAFLDSRKKFLEGVVVCGGEPTIDPNLPEFLRKIKQRGFLVKLDTNGTNPAIVKRIIDEKLADYVAMDIKSSKEGYAKAVGVAIDLSLVEETIRLLMDYGSKGVIDYEFRTTVVPGLVSREDVLKIARWISGAKKYVLQQYRNMHVLDESFSNVEPYGDNDLRELKASISGMVQRVELKNLA
ncbi:MAG TPA: anaerobic ribonucleoside-triphosphate reductase activating protein [Candidatus Nanoarchaeia archaeon]|nr:anaerobic ribonucleoside-triphosphate reductase activating protein [Candidatus Nanoarchaeia archaeon]